MGEILVSYYEFVKKEGGIKAAMRVAMQTAVTATKAGSIPDSPEMISKFKKAIKEVTGKVPPR